MSDRDTVLSANIEAYVDKLIGLGQIPSDSRTKFINDYRIRAGLPPLAN